MKDRHGRCFGLALVWLMAATLTLAACAPRTGQDTAPTSTSTTAAPTTVAETRSGYPPRGPIEPGTYHIVSSAWSIVELTLTMPEGWETEYGPPTAIKHSDQDRELAFYFVIVDAIYSDPCLGSAGGASALMEVGPSVDDLANALLEQPFTVATEPVDTMLGGLPAKKIGLSIADDFDAAACNIPGDLQIWYSAPADKYFVLLGDGTASVYILDVNGERQVFYTQQRTGTTGDDINEMQTIIESITIDP